MEAVPGSWKRGSVVAMFLLFWLPPRNDLLLLMVRTPRSPHEFILRLLPVRGPADSVAAAVGVVAVLAEQEGVVPVSFIVKGGNCGVAAAGDFLLTRLTGASSPPSTLVCLVVLVDTFLAGHESEPTLNPSDGICVFHRSLLVLVENSGNGSGWG